jgi:hypothetical protein
VEQVAPEEHEAHEEAPKEQEGSSSEDGDEEGAQQGGRPASAIAYQLHVS